MKHITQNCTCETGGTPAETRIRTRRLRVCDACGEIRARPREAADGEAGASVAALAHLAPNGILRDRYRLIDVLGQGAHGVTWFAEHVFLSHPCVVKFLSQISADSADPAGTRLRAEARAGFQVTDPCVVRVLDCDMVGRTWYFVMEYVDGAPLSDGIDAGLRLPWQQVLRIALDAAQGLAAIHRVNLVHRDIKPANLLLGADGRVRIADLGVAAVVSDSAGSSPTSALGSGMTGTLAYAAPEVFVTGAEVGPASDLYSLGVTLYQLLTGRLPYASEGVFARLIDSQCRAAEWPAECRDDAPGWLTGAILRLLSIDPAKRFESPQQLGDYLRQHSAQPQPHPPAAAPAGDQLRPRGVGVLAFENEGDGPADDWIGLALAGSLARSLARRAGVYVADPESLAPLVAQGRPRLAILRGLSAEEMQRRRLLEAGRVVGAETMITGRFLRRAQSLRVTIDFLRNDTAPAPIHVEAPLARLSDVDATLLEGVLDRLGLGAATPAAAADIPAIVPAAQEQFARAKQAFLRGEYETAIEHAGQALALDRDFAEAIGCVGVCHARLGRYEDAERCYGDEEILGRRRGDLRSVVEAQANRGVMNYFRGRYEAACEDYRGAAELARQAGLATELAQIHNNLGFVLFRLGQPQEAEQSFLHAIETHRANGALISLIGPFNGVGNVLLEQGRLEEAAEYYRRALALAREVGDRANIGASHMHLGRCAALAGRFADAKNEFAVAFNALEDTRFWNGLARVYEYVADMNLQLGDLEEAVRCADERLKLAQRHANQRTESAALAQKGEALRRLGRDEEARQCLARAERCDAATAAPAGAERAAG